MQLRELQKRIGHQEFGYRYFEAKVRGPERLRNVCGDATLTEVTGAAFWSFADDIPIPSDLGDARPLIPKAIPTRFDYSLLLQLKSTSILLRTVQNSNRSSPAK